MSWSCHVNSIPLRRPSSYVGMCQLLKLYAGLGGGRMTVYSASSESAVVAVSVYGRSGGTRGGVIVNEDDRLRTLGVRAIGRGTLMVILFRRA